MSAELIAQIESIDEQIAAIESDLTDFLNHQCVDTILEDEELIDEEYIQSVLKQLRFLEVYCSEGCKALRKLKKHDHLNQEIIDKVFKGIYFKCVTEFFTPKDDLWYEDSRASYADKCSIDLQHKSGVEIEALICKIEPRFQTVREEIDYLEIK
ncbi:hypothetical protein CEY16_03810 [Halalkalibacillus sediminis]|uniref:DUF3907 domain-containing protein n=1 Tax=Halalkalibacillus sediminis TaxID=2018042 RepID=A0A2I0QX22_9BACI|nr:DUF3907 family protein [Halalkalibacillus sediminis]PKR78892.1 hypothetical protein CEY16_03810 [Halalkalibacillus sediminis]